MQAGDAADLPDDRVLLLFCHHREGLLHRETSIQEISQLAGEKDQFRAVQPWLDGAT